MLISNLRSGKFKLIQPLPILTELEEDGSEVIIFSADLDMWGTGEDLQEAIDDFCGALVEYYEFLIEHAENLSSIPARDYRFLKQFVIRNS